MNWLKGIGYVGGLALGVIYLLNPTAGVIELIPDNLPIVGHLDEAAAMGLVIQSFRGLRKLRSKPE